MDNEPEILLPLQPVQITVNPTPSLIVKYFIETELQVSCVLSTAYRQAIHGTLSDIMISLYLRL